MDRDSHRNLEILTAIAEGSPLSQRTLAARLGVALGLTNLYLKRLAKKGYIKIVEFPRKPSTRRRLRYLVTPKGFAEKTRLTYEHMAYSLTLYRRTRQTLRDSLELLLRGEARRAALFGTDEAAELAFLTMKELGLDPIGVFARGGGGRFLGFPVRDVRELLAEDFDVLVLATFERPEPWIEELATLGLPARKFVTLRRVDPRLQGNGLRHG